MIGGAKFFQSTNKYFFKKKDTGTSLEFKYILHNRKMLEIKKVFFSSS